MKRQFIPEGKRRHRLPLKSNFFSQQQHNGDLREHLKYCSERREWPPLMVADESIKLNSLLPIERQKVRMANRKLLALKTPESYNNGLVNSVRFSCFLRLGSKGWNGAPEIKVPPFTPGAYSKSGNLRCCPV